MATDSDLRAYLKRFASSPLMRATLAIGILVELGLFAAAWVASLKWLPPLTLSRSDARAAFGAILTYLPVILIALYVQANRANFNTLESVSEVQRRHLALITRSFSAEQDLIRAEEGADPGESDEALRQARAEFDDERIELRALHDRVLSLSREAITDARPATFLLLMNLCGILASMLGLIAPAHFLFTTALGAAAVVTFELVTRILDPLIAAYETAETLAWALLLIAPFMLFSGALLGLLHGLRLT